MHPVQPPPPTDIASREFAPGPFTYARLEETYHSTLASDLLAMTYTHVAPGDALPSGVDRNRPWVGDSPYFKNRPPKGPRGSARFLPMHRPINFENIPELKKVVVHTHVKGAYSNSNWLQVASLVIQAISGSQVTVHKSKRNVMEWEARKDKWTSVTATLEGENMYHFLAKVIEIVLPRIKDYKGVAGTSGDSSGNISFGLSPEEVALFPEVEVNYDMYPTEMMPGCHITVQTSAVTDREARLMLMTMGVPFHGEMKR
jgi:large subunit ribosomal protein L5